MDLHTLLSQFVALRHEVNLQTKATRVQQELNVESLRQLGQAVEALRRPQALALAADSQAQDEQLRPLLKALVDIYDALALAGRQVQRVQDGVWPALEQIRGALQPLPESPRSSALAPVVPARDSFFARWFGQEPEEPAAVVASTQVEDEQRQRRLSMQQDAQEAAERIRQVLDSVVTGYTMSVQRVERVLQQQGLEPIPAVGQPFDPEQMEVVDVVHDSGEPANQVVEEVRRGYLWRDRVFRYAQVRVAKP